MHGLRMWPLLLSTLSPCIPAVQEADVRQLRMYNRVEPWRFLSVLAPRDPVLDRAESSRTFACSDEAPALEY